MQSTSESFSRPSAKEVPLQPQAETVESQNALPRADGASEEFQKALQTDRKLLKRVQETIADLARIGEPIKTLRETEVFADLFKGVSTKISTAFEAVDPVRSSKRLRNAEATEVRQLRMHTFNEKLRTIKDPTAQAEIQRAVTQGIESVGLGQDPDALLTIAEDENLFKRFSQHPGAREAYEALMSNRSLEDAGRQVEAYYRKGPQGEKIPVMHIDRFAVNAETGSVVEFGFDIEKQKRVDRKTGELREQRIVKNPVIVMDAEARGSSSGLKFIVGLLPMTKKLKLDAAELVCNIKQGSYTWARIADIDSFAMAEQLPPQAIQELGPGPWEEKRLKGMVMRDIILPQFEQNISTSIGQVLEFEKDPEKKTELYKQLVTDLYYTEYPKLKEKALRGEITMNELANLGKGINAFKFNEEGKLTDQDSHITGHLGKTALLGPGKNGIPWKATIGLDRASLFKLVEGLSPGTGLMDKVKRAGMKAGIMAADLLSRIQNRV